MSAELFESTKRWGRWGDNDERVGTRFPDMSDAYSKQYREIAKRVAAELFIPLGEGVYAAMTGPSYETPAEIRYLRVIGADVVGMSTVAESIVGCDHRNAEPLIPSSLRCSQTGVVGSQYHNCAR